MKLTFGDIVVVEKNLIGIVVKCWESEPETMYEVYVRNWNTIQDYSESKLERYLVRHKELDDEELRYQHNAVTAGKNGVRVKIDD